MSPTLSAAADTPHNHISLMIMIELSQIYVWHPPPSSSKEVIVWVFANIFSASSPQHALNQNLHMKLENLKVGTTFNDWEDHFCTYLIFFIEFPQLHLKIFDMSSNVWFSTSPPKSNMFYDSGSGFCVYR
jgi:hypothetical protein